MNNSKIMIFLLIITLIKINNSQKTEFTDIFKTNLTITNTTTRVGTGLFHIKGNGDYMELYCSLFHEMTDIISIEFKDSSNINFTQTLNSINGKNEKLSLYNTTFYEAIIKERSYIQIKTSKKKQTNQKKRYD
jgi:hypothetical protein